MHFGDKAAQIVDLNFCSAGGVLEYPQHPIATGLGSWRKHRIFKFAANARYARLKTMRGYDQGQAES